MRFILDKEKQNIFWRLGENSLGVNDKDIEYGPHTLLKLAYLNYYIGIFTTIANSRKKNHGFNRILFIDAFGGSGLVRIRGTAYNALGSSLLAAANGKFDRIVSFEIDDVRADLLSKRLDVLAPGKARVVKGDVNSEIARIVDEEVNSRTIVLLFVDPEGMEPQFSRLRSIIDKTKFVDIVMNYTWGVYRLQGRIEKTFSEADIRKMKSFLPKYECGKTPDEVLLEMFENEFGKPYGDVVSINSKGDKTEYSMILRVRRTTGDSKFVDAMKKFGKIIESYDGDQCRKVADIIMGIQSAL